MKKIKTLLIITILLGAIILPAQTPKKVLFAGNSYTYFWNLPQHVSVMAEEQDIKIETSQSTTGGCNLKHHWKSEKKLNTMQLIDESYYDAVVLQDQSMRAIEAKDSLIHYGKLLAEAIKSKGGKVYLYQTWAREATPETQDIITNAYAELAEIADAEVVPVGEVWKRARELRPNIKLFDPDGSHPSSFGTYLTACVFYSVFTKKSPVGLPHRLETKDKNGDKIYINMVSREGARFCQELAWEVVSEKTE